MRPDSRRSDQLREISIVPNYTGYAEGSILIKLGGTKVLCNASPIDEVPNWIRVQGRPHGWITAEYVMLPRSTHDRRNREILRPAGRTMEIQRMIGRNLRTAVNLDKLGSRTCTIDCDVLQSDGGTRTASITGGFIALAIALQQLIVTGKIPSDTITNEVSAVSVCVVDGIPLLDPCYEEDSTADADANIVMDSYGNFIEVQISSEKAPITNRLLNQIIILAQNGINQLISIQRNVLKYSTYA